MNSLPSWVQIHGLPPDCWNHHVLSTLASYMGTPVHMDMLTHDRKRVNMLECWWKLTFQSLNWRNIHCPTDWKGESVFRV